MTTTTPPQLRGRWRAKPELDELLAEALGARHRSAVATRLDVTYECARLWLTGARTVSPDVATRLARIAGKTRAEVFTEARQVTAPPPILAARRWENDGGPTPTAGPPTSSPATMMHPDRSAVTVASSPQPVDKGGDNPGEQHGE